MADSVLLTYDPITGNFAVTYQNVTTSNVTGIAVSNSVSTQLMAANPNRTQAIIFNGAAQNMYVKLGTGCANNSFTYFLPTRTSVVITGWQGPIHALLASGAGFAFDTELSYP